MSYDLTKIKYASPTESRLTVKHFYGILETDLTEDFILPEYISDVRRILHTSANIRLISCAESGDLLECSGEVTCRVLLQTETDGVRCVTQKLPFTCSVSIEQQDSAVSESTIIAMPAVEGLAVRLLNPRRISVRAHPAVNVRMYARCKSLPVIKGAESSGDEECIERDTRLVNVMHIISAEAKNCTVSYDFELENSMPSAAEVVYCSVRICPSEYRASHSDMEIGCESEAQIVYRTDDGGAMMFTKRFKHNLKIPLNESADGCEYLANITPYNIRATAENNSFGESRVIELDFEADVALTCIRNDEAEITRDVYSTEYASTNVCRNIGVYALKRCAAVNFTQNTVKALSELSASEGIQPAFTDVSIKKGDIWYDAERRRTVYGSDAEITVVSRGDNGEMTAYTFTTSLKYEFDMGDLLVNDESFSDAQAFNIRCRSDGVSVYCDFEVMLTATIVERSDVSYVSETSIDHSKRVDRTKRPSIILYYPADGERLWDIAKRYSTTREALSAANNITGDTASGNKVMIIPRKKPPVYSRVI